MRIITARARRAEKEVRPRTSKYNITDNINQLSSVMQATEARLTRHLHILAYEGLNPATLNCLVCDDAIRAAENRRM